MIFSDLNKGSVAIIPCVARVLGYVLHVEVKLERINVIEIGSGMLVVQ
jgi:hypothetical protein